MSNATGVVQAPREISLESWEGEDDYEDAESFSSFIYADEVLHQLRSATPPTPITPVRLPSPRNATPPKTEQPGIRLTKSFMPPVLPRSLTSLQVAQRSSSAEAKPKRHSEPCLTKPSSNASQQEEKENRARVFLCGPSRNSRPHGASNKSFAINCTSRGWCADAQAAVYDEQRPAEVPIARVPVAQTISTGRLAFVTSPLQHTPEQKRMEKDAPLVTERETGKVHVQDTQSTPGSLRMQQSPPYGLAFVASPLRRRTEIGAVLVDESKGAQMHTGRHRAISTAQGTPPGNIVSISGACDTSLVPEVKTVQKPPNAGGFVVPVPQVTALNADARVKLHEGPDAAIKAHPLSARACPYQRQVSHLQDLGFNVPCNTCKEGHPLMRIHSEQHCGLWMCDGCGQRFDGLPDSGRVRCAPCDFDLCGACASKWRRPASSVLKCSKGHVLMIRASVSPWICGSCNRSSDRSSDVGSLHCDSCGFDLCCECMVQLGRQRTAAMCCPQGKVDVEPPQFMQNAGSVQLRPDDISRTWPCFGATAGQSYSNQAPQRALTEKYTHSWVDSAHNDGPFSMLRPINKGYSDRT